MYCMSLSSGFVHGFIVHILFSKVTELPPEKPREFNVDFKMPAFSFYVYLLSLLHFLRATHCLGMLRYVSLEENIMVSSVNSSVQII